jgi:hypothetical protein
MRFSVHTGAFFPSADQIVIVFALSITGQKPTHPLNGGRALRTFFKTGGALAVSVCLFLFVATPAAAYFDTGNEVYERCIAPDKTSKRQICLATASAYLDMMRALGYACTGDNLTLRQVADAFVKFLKENAESRQKSGPSLAIEAFSKGFGCKTQ